MRQYSNFISLFLTPKLPELNHLKGDLLLLAGSMVGEYINRTVEVPQIQQQFQTIKMSTDYGSSQPVFQKLRNNIQRLKVEREQVSSQYNVDRNDLNAIDASMGQLARQVEERMTFIREKERQLMELQKAINETEKSYDIIVETTRKLSNALETESLHLRGMAKK